MIRRCCRPGMTPRAMRPARKARATRPPVRRRVPDRSGYRQYRRSGDGFRSHPSKWLPPRTTACTELRLIGAHLKSKAPHGARSRDEIMRKAIANRRKQQAQAVWLRQRVEAHLAAGEHLIVLGDMNDGPGLDEYENLFGHSSVEIIMGEGAAPGNGPLRPPCPARAATPDRGDQHDLAFLSVLGKALYSGAAGLHHGLTRVCAPRGRIWRIWHPFDDPNCWNLPELRNALITASDHFPVTMDLDI